MDRECLVTGRRLGLRVVWRDGLVWEVRLVRIREAGAGPEAAPAACQEGLAPGAPLADLSAAQGPVQEAWAASLAEALARYEAGQPPQWPDLPLAWERLTPFARQVLVTLRDQAPPGRTLTYGELAALCGRPGAARAVGRVMAKNPWPLLYPCHRVVGAGGRMVGFSAEGGVGLKAEMLGWENVVPGKEKA